MIVSRARHPYLFNAIAGFILGVVCCMSLYTERINNEETLFYPQRFFIVVLCASLVSSGGMILILAGKRKIIIHADVIEVQLRFGFEKIHFNHEEIINMVWGSGSTVMSGVRRGNSSMIGNKFIEITFRDKSVLTIDEYNYKNFEELRDWFYSYCRYRGIIDLQEIEKRRKARRARSYRRN